MYRPGHVEANEAGLHSSILRSSEVYENWKAAFLACVDQALATPEYKLLQLRQCLSGEALNVIENVGHSATAYQPKTDWRENMGVKGGKLPYSLKTCMNSDPLNRVMQKMLNTLLICLT